jgi:hypothetical protein
MEPAGANQNTIRLAALGALQRQVIPCAKMKIMLTDEALD